MDLRPASTVSTEGTVDFTTAFQGTDETHLTWYKIVNPPPSGSGNTRDAGADASGGKPLPLVVLHGGPGCTHDYLLSLADLARDGRQVIFYDQIGNGRSTHLPERGADFWTVDLFVRELHNLLDALGLKESGYHLLGQSSGGFLAQEFALTRPRGLQAVVCRIDPMPPDVRATFDWLDRDPSPRTWEERDRYMTVVGSWLRNHD